MGQRRKSKISENAKGRLAIGLRETEKRTPPRVTPKATGEHIGQHRAVRHEQVVLKNHPGVTLEIGGGVQPALQATILNLTFGRRHEAVETTQEGGFADPGRADHCDKFTAWHIEVHPTEQPMFTAPQAEPADRDMTDRRFLFR